MSKRRRVGVEIPIGKDFNELLFNDGYIVRDVEIGGKMWTIEFKPPVWDVITKAEIMANDIRDEKMKNLNMLINITRSCLVKAGNIPVDEKFWSKVPLDIITIIGKIIIEEATPRVSKKNLRRHPVPPGMLSASQVPEGGQQSPTQS
ncbi:hypothetical protein KKF45_04710 [Patescibacteria group bacterium]|nr:hypothetical protein [Patescibacteria group bacterium]